jgi:hypothetical protein
MIRHYQRSYFSYNDSISTLNQKIAHVFSEAMQALWPEDVNLMKCCSSLQMPCHT